MRTFLIALVALIVGGVIGVGYGMVQVDEVTQKLTITTQERDLAVQSADRMRKTNEEAVRRYGTELGRQVTAASAIVIAPPAPAAEPVAGQPAPAPAAPSADAVKLLDQVRALLATRDGFRATVDGLRAALNSEFDALAAELGNPAPDALKVKQVVDTLKANWAVKEKNMDDATRRLLADLGLLRAPALSVPAVEPAPPAAPTTPPAAEKK